MRLQTCVAAVTLLQLLELAVGSHETVARTAAQGQSRVVTSLQNPMPLFNSSGQPMDVHDGDVRQWTPGGPFYYYGMRYDRCHYQFCAQKNCSHLKDHTVLIWRSDTLGNRSWTLVGEALGPAALKVLGNFYRPHVQYNPTTKRYVMIVNGNGLGNYKNFAATSASPEGPFTDPQDMDRLAFEIPANCPNGNCEMGDFGFFAEGADAYLVVNVMGPGAGVHVEKLNVDWTNGLNDTSQTSACLTCAGPPQESPSMYKTAAGKYVVLLAGATCFGVPQPTSGRWNGNYPVGPAEARWGGTGIFVYVADKPLGPYTFYGNINNAVGGLHNASGCTVCMGNPCPAGKCVVPVQLNSIVRDHSGTPLALTGGMWALNSREEVTNVLGDYAEYWQPWDNVVDTTGLPKQLVYLEYFTLSLPPAVNDSV